MDNYWAKQQSMDNLVKELAAFIEEYQQTVEESLGVMDYTFSSSLVTQN
jgi:hypothetical protein